MFDHEIAYVLTIDTMNRSTYPLVTSDFADIPVPCIYEASYAASAAILSSTQRTRYPHRGSTCLITIHITLSPALVSLHLKLVTLSLQRNEIFPGEELSVCHIRKAAFRVAPTDTSRCFYGEYVELDMAVCKPVCLCTTSIEVHTDLCSG
ncbi:uncharacterized protein ASPGLDRAFT_1227130 [Aspergillus glaucus CBS 516.65]|uniref:Uncharacterized protein n=1 Tax=Aspergillus glaucus CBS 516.65 TaxID=1160497 RepID=A0A1L9VR91_ASPGL|nr:hypothetical protein ASPGLDRAFT_1227130 [Aspergillus glaucus CBS 516.65]OJJ86427.1 hypothetical protein ASPGLDRAFT_1227130 [Aspergillus glaucus CBS 516.65]